MNRGARTSAKPGYPVRSHLGLSFYASGFESWQTIHVESEQLQGPGSKDSSSLLREVVPVT